MRKFFGQKTRDKFAFNMSLTPIAKETESKTDDSCEKTKKLFVIVSGKIFF